MNFSAFTVDGCFVVFRFFAHASHELAPKVDLQRLRPSQRAAFVNRLKGLRSLSRVSQGQRLSFFVAAVDDDNGELLFVNFRTAGQLFMWQKKKVCLVDRVTIRRIIDGENSVARKGRSAREPVR